MQESEEEQIVHRQLLQLSAQLATAAGGLETATRLGTRSELASPTPELAVLGRGTNAPTGPEERTALAHHRPAPSLWSC